MIDLHTWLVSRELTNVFFVDFFFSNNPNLSPGTIQKMKLSTTRCWSVRTLSLSPTSTTSTSTKVLD